MIKNPLLPALIFVISLSVNIYSQDFNLLNPSNEMYLFSAYDEGANAFRYNPAVLGLNHRFNATVNAFIKTLSGSTALSEIDVLANFGRLGISYRMSNETITPSYYYSYDTISYHQLHQGYTDEFAYRTNTISLGFGIGNKTISAGILGEYMFKESSGSLADYNNSNPRYRLGIGFLYRPSELLSASFTAKNNSSLSIHSYTGHVFTTGTAIRPLGNDRLTLAADFSFAPYVNKGIFEYYRMKIGAEAELLKGLSVNANYTRVQDFIRNESFNIGFTLWAPNTSVRYNHSFNNTRTQNVRDEYYPYPIDNKFVFTAGAKYKYVGSSFSFSYSAEKHESIIPEKKKVVEIVLSGSMQDFNTEDVFFGLLGHGKRSVHEVIADIDYAASDPSCRGLLFKIYPLTTGRLDVTAALEELSGAMERFKAKGKKITAFLPQDAGPSEYYLATYADNIVIPPEALFFYGLSINVINYRQFLQKYGIELQNFNAGKYKLTFQGILDSTSEEGKEVINRMLDVVYEKMMSRLISARNITIDDYMKTKISQPMTAKDAFRLGLVDKLGWYEDAKDVSEKNTKISNVVKSLNRSEWDNGWGEPDQIAIVGVYGLMTTGESQPPPPITLPIPYIGGSRSTGSETVVRQLEDAFSNPKVKTVILRVESGGGSVLASAEINEALIRLRKKYSKPFYVSMGGSAASGGYYISCSADKIFTDELTITGSIGVYTSRPNLDSLIDRQKIKVENFKRGENSDIGSFFKKLTPAEIEIIQGIIDYYYERFIEAITAGRKMTKEEVEQVAQGRVWLGSDALNKKLVDEIGGLYETVQYALKKNSFGKRYKLVYYSVPGGETVSDVITASAIKYIEQNILNLTGMDGSDDNIEIKY